MEFRGYLEFLRQLGGQLERLTGVEREKIRAVQAADLTALDGCIRQEQAAGLALRGLEQRREALVRELGLPDGALRRLPELCPPELRRETAETVEAVLRQYQVLQSARDAARTLLECELHKVEGRLAQRGLEAEDAAEDAPLPPELRTDFRA